MIFAKTTKAVLTELKHHAPFTILGAFLGILFMLIFRNAPHQLEVTFFKIAHPGHIVFSAFVTAAMLRCHTKFRKNFLAILIIAWIGAIGVATLSDIIIPHFLGTKLFNLNIPTHPALHEILHDDKIQSSAENNNQTDHKTDNIHNQIHDHAHDHDHDNQHVQAHADTHDHQHAPGLHLAFIEDWLLVNSAAIVGVLLGFFRPTTRFPHAAHVLISTWAGSAYILMTTVQPIGITVMFALIIVLFISVWIPCCISDIVFPLLFIDKDADFSHCLHIHKHS